MPKEQVDAIVARLNTTKALDDHGNATKHNVGKVSGCLQKYGENTGKTAYWSRTRNRCCEYLRMDQRKITKKSSYQTRWKLVLYTFVRKEIGDA